MKALITGPSLVDDILQRLRTVIKKIERGERLYCVALFSGGEIAALLDDGHPIIC